MRSVLLSMIVVLASPTAAWAYCVQVPDDASTGYVANQTQLTLCRASEAGALASRQARDLELRASISAQILLMQQQLRMQQALQPPPAIVLLPMHPAF